MKRERGTFRDVHVIWRLTWSSGIVNASYQISPMNGSLTFEQVRDCELIRILNCFSHETVPCLSHNPVMAGKASKRSLQQSLMTAFSHSGRQPYLNISKCFCYYGSGGLGSANLFAEVVLLHLTSRLSLRFYWTVVHNLCSLRI